MAKYMSDFRQGDTVKLIISYVTDEGVITDITGYQFRLTLLTDFGKTATLVVNTTAGDDPNDIPDEGLAHIEISSTDSATVPPGKYIYFLQRIIPGAPDNVYTIMPPIKDHKDKVLVVDGAA